MRNYAAAFLCTVSNECHRTLLQQTGKTVRGDDLGAYFVYRPGKSSGMILFYPESGCVDLHSPGIYHGYYPVRHFTACVYIKLGQ
jgi:hypothetical protein